ncbi:GtrA family protein [Sphingomonas morindae]|uniref:GtrA family protein n=1 Tax=Sphingomonas morindae TaxID=1541170 RepID=A0ABY4XBF1_9SPHN|nr:GtrA family protein [Sphingomonas morindae]USI74204.1 GtrA family protein [Sphingomonas morindae]
MRSGIARLWHILEDDHRVMVAQLARYGFAGVGVTLFQIAVYNALAGPHGYAPLIANSFAFVAAMLLGYTIHSRFSFQGHGRRDNVARSAGRFVIASLIGFAINSFWVWSLTGLLHLPHWAPSLPMFFVTPFALFWLNRRWVFG